MKITINPAIRHVQPFIERLPEVFPVSGEVLHEGRNQIRAFDIGGESLVVKRYKRPHLFNRVMYSFFRKNKARLEKRLRENAFERCVDVDEVSSFAPEAEEDEFQIVRTKRFPIKLMSAEEAVLQMNLVDHTFFAFKNAEADGAFSVVYRRNDGGYGLIEDDI